MPDVEILKQASWGATRDNLVLGGEANGIDGAHILSPLPYRVTTGKVTQNAVPTPMYLLARLNLDAQAISVASEHKDLKLGTSSAPLKEAFAKKRAAGGDPKVAMHASRAARRGGRQRACAGYARGGAGQRHAP